MGTVADLKKLAPGAPAAPVLFYVIFWFFYVIRAEIHDFGSSFFLCHLRAHGHDLGAHGPDSHGPRIISGPIS